VVAPIDAIGEAEKAALRSSRKPSFASSAATSRAVSVDVARGRHNVARRAIVSEKRIPSPKMKLGAEAGRASIAICGAVQD
jgi:hypothetical protein